MLTLSSFKIAPHGPILGSLSDPERDFQDVRPNEHIINAMLPVLTVFALVFLIRLDAPLYFLGQGTSFPTLTSQLEDLADTQQVSDHGYTETEASVGASVISSLFALLAMLHLTFGFVRYGYRLPMPQPWGAAKRTARFCGWHLLASVHVTVATSLVAAVW